MEKIILNNNIPLVLKENTNTPRHALCFYFKITEPEKKAGVYTLLNRLFLQGTKKRSAQVLAQELDENAIDCYSEMKQDFIRFKLQCLNEDFEKGLEILSDIIQNSTLEDFEKEVIKLKGEIQAELDEPKTLAMNAFYSTVFKNHPYGHTYTNILRDIDSITIEDVKNAYKSLLEKSPKVISLVGDFHSEDTAGLLNKYFENIQNCAETEISNSVEDIEKAQTVKVAKDDASQAQIIQGWRVPTIFDKDYAPIMVMNTMLGSSGLSSRLFLELRDKKGLAYVVRSTYEIYDNAALFNVYIATEPKNIKTSLEGFKVELDKVKQIPVTEAELENAKNNLLGKRQFFTETNLQQASLIAYYEDKGLGSDFELKFVDMVNSVTVEDIQRVANTYITDRYVLAVLAPQQFLKEL